MNNINPSQTIYNKGPIFRVYNEHDDIAPYSPGSIIPIWDMINTVKSFFCSLKTGDNEELFDSSTNVLHFIASPPKSLSQLGEIIHEFNWIPTSTYSVFRFISRSTGCVLSVLSFLLNTYWLYRHKNCEDLFTLDVLSLFHRIINADKRSAPIYLNKIRKIISNDPRLIKWKKRIEDLENYPIEGAHYQQELQGIAKEILLKNLEIMQNDFLSLDASEIDKIVRKVRRKWPQASPEDSIKLIKKSLYNHSILKKKKLSRCISPWMSERVNRSCLPIIHELSEHDASSPMALKEGLRLANDMNIQFKKKETVYKLIIIISIISIISLFPFPIVIIPYILTAIIVVLTVASITISTTMFDQVGWTCEPKKIIPLFIRKRIFKPDKAPYELSDWLKEKIIEFYPNTPLQKKVQI